ncbi:OLC1v1010060C2 [Oldenlandia corymbosa var. corymbosa]|nr:OLC1v1010060C2 [Oldenlandia corymbosa var. corymbosa]
MRALISERVESKKSGGSNIDVLDDLLSLCKETPEEVDRDLIEHLFLDMFIAGTDTTSNTVEWGMAQLLKNPKVLKKAQAELEEVIGRGKKLEESDIARLPYLQCVVKETMRLHPAVPFLIRKVEKDVKIFDYILPGGSRVLVNVWAIGRDETAWEDASVFKPERFVGSDIDIRGRDFDLIPFGAGRRTCPGLSLAVRAVPVMIGSLINMFDWKLEGGIKREELDLDEKFGITLQKARPLRAVPVGLKI